MIEKAIAYKKSDKDFISTLKKLGLSEDEIKLILKKYKRKKFEGGGDGGGGDGGGDGGDGGGDGGDSGGDSGDGDSGDSGPGGSDDGSGHGGPGPGSDAGPGIGDTMGSSTADDAAANQAASEAAAQAATDQATIGMQQNPDVEAPTGIMSTLSNMARQAFNAYTAISPTAIAMNAINNAISNAQRGVTPANDYSQVTESVQTSTPGPNNNGGISTIQNYAPLYNISTGDNTADALRTRLNNLIQIEQPSIMGIPSISPYSNYTLLDLYRNRYI